MIVLLFGFGVNPVIAGGLSLLAILGSAGIGTLSNIRQSAISKSLFINISFFAGIGAIIGSVVPYYINTESFDFLFGFVSISIGIFSILATRTDAKSMPSLEKSFISMSKAEREEAKRVAGRFGISSLSFIAGVLAGAFGIGIGGIMGTYLTAIKNMQPKIAFSTVLAAMIITSLLGSYIHLAYVNKATYTIAMGVALLFGVVIGAYLGSAISSKLKSKSLRFAQGYIILLLGIVAIIFSMAV